MQEVSGGLAGEMGSVGRWSSTAFRKRAQGSNQAQQIGRGLSDQDFNIFRKIVGNPDSFFSEQNIFVSGMRRLQKTATRMMKARHQILQKNDVGGGSSQGATGGLAGKTNEELRQMLLEAQ